MGLAILLVEDDVRFAAVVARHLAKAGHQVEAAASGEEGLRLFRERSPDLVLLDLMLPGIDGLQTLQQMKQIDEAVAVVVITAHASVAGAVEAVRLGALDYVSKPLDLEALELKLAQTQELLGLRSDLGYLLEREQRTAGPGRFIGSSPAMQEVYARIREVAKTNNTTVLVTGPSGTGKEITARAIHALSSRNKKPLMQIDCTAIPIALMESELFGHERGAFTGADQTKKGLLELADGGTLLLDEIGDLELGLQGKLLRVLQERQFRRVGGSRDLRFDVRVIAATNQELDRMASEGRFRRDLLYRLKVFQIELPPLAQRGDDVLELSEAFLQHYARTFNKRLRGLDSEARRKLASHKFPGNVRELRNLIEQAVILAKGEWITAQLLAIPEPQSEESDVPVSSSPAIVGSGATPAASTGDGHSASPAPPISLDALGERPLETAERELIRQALSRSGGNKKRAAELLGISRFALQRKLDRLALQSLGMSDRAGDKLR